MAEPSNMCVRESNAKIVLVEAEKVETQCERNKKGEIVLSVEF